MQLTLSYTYTAIVGILILLLPWVLLFIDTMKRLHPFWEANSNLSFNIYDEAYLCFTQTREMRIRIRNAKIVPQEVGEIILSFLDEEWFVGPAVEVDMRPHEQTILWNRFFNIKTQ